MSESEMFCEVNLLVPTQRQALGSQRVTGDVLPTLNIDCEAHSGRVIKRYGPN